MICCFAFVSTTVIWVSGWVGQRDLTGDELTGWDIYIYIYSFILPPSTYISLPSCPWPTNAILPFFVSQTPHGQCYTDVACGRPRSATSSGSTALQHRALGMQTAPSKQPKQRNQKRYLQTSRALRTSATKNRRRRSKKEESHPTAG